MTSDAGGARRGAPLAVMASTVSGFVDAFVYLAIQPVFVANQSGNLILLGMSLGGANVGGAGSPAAAVIGYGSGAAIAIGLFPERGGGRRRLRGVFVTEAVILALLGFATGPAGDPQRSPAGVLAVGLVTLAAVSQGTVAVAVRSVGGLSVLATASTGNLTEMGTLAGQLPRSTERPRLRRGLLLVGGVVAGYLGGAALGTVGVRATGGSPWLLTLPIAAVMLAALAVGWTTPARRRRTRE